MMNAAKSEIKELSPIEFQLSIVVPGEQTLREANLAYQKLGSSAKLKGFRQGHVPRHVLEQYYKPEVEYKVLQSVVSKSYREAVDEHKLHPVSEPEIKPVGEFQLGQDFNYTANIEVKPVIELKKWKGIAFEAPVFSVTDQEINDELEQLRDAHSSIVPVTDRTEIMQGDLVEANIAGETGPRVIQVGSGQYSVEAEQALVGKTLNTEVVAGEITLTPIGIKTKKKPALDDEFAKDVSDKFETLDALKTAIRESLDSQKTKREEDGKKRAVMDALIEANPFEVPNALIAKQSEYMAARMLSQFGEQQAAKLWEQLGDKLKESAKPEATRNVRGDLLLEAIAKEEGIEASDADIDAEFEKEAARMQVPASRLKSRYKQDDLETLRFHLKTNKALDLVIAKAKIKTVEKPWREPK